MFAVVVMVVPTVAVAIAIAVPVMVVLKPAARSFPVSAVVAATFIARNNADCALVRPARPVGFVPVIMSTHWIPITFDPSILIFVLWFGARRPNCIDARCWWRADYNSDRDLAACGWCANKQGATEE